MRPAVLARATAAAALAVLALPAAALASTEGVPADLSVSLSGPATGQVGGTGDWTVSVANTGTTEAFRARVTLVLPQDVQVASVGVTDDWICVLTPDLSCELAAELPAGEAADPIPVELSYGPASAGTHELAALAHQEEGARVDRGTATVVVSAPSPPPTTAPPATTPPATAAPAPQPATAPRRTAVAPATVTPEASETPPAVVDPGPLPVEPAPEPALDEPAALPFAVDEATEEPTDEPTDEPQAAVVTPVSDDGMSPAVFALGVVVGLLVLAEGVLLVRMLLRRRAAASA